MKDFQEGKELARELFLLAGKLVQLFLNAGDERATLIEQAKKTPAGICYSFQE